MTHKIRRFGRILMILGIIFDLSKYITALCVILRFIPPAEKVRKYIRRHRRTVVLGSKLRSQDDILPPSVSLPSPSRVTWCWSKMLSEVPRLDINNDWRDNLLGKYLSPSNTRQAGARYDGLTANINIPPDQPERKRFRWKKSWLKLISKKYVLVTKYKTTNLVATVITETLSYIAHGQYFSKSVIDYGSSKVVVSALQLCWGGGGWGLTG